MIDIKKLSKLTWLHLNEDEEKTLWKQIESVVSLLDKVKDYDIPNPTNTRHNILWLETKPSKLGIPDGTSEWILKNIDHPIIGHAIEVKAFVE